MLKLSPTLSLPTEAVTQTFAILAKRGSGKTYTAAVFTEELLKAGLPVVVVDPIGVWWGLRASADGQHPGLSILVVGGEHADVPITRDSGGVLAVMVAQQQISMVIDLSQFNKADQHRIMLDFSTQLYQAKAPEQYHTAVQIIMDEADEFAPQRPMPGEQTMLGAVETLVRRGRARGIGVTLITQRPAVLNKNVLTQIEVLVALRLTSPQDRAALNEWVKFHADTDTAKEMIETLPNLPIGTAWFWSPGWLEIFEKVAIRKRETLDSSSTPKAGQARVEAKSMADVNMDEIRKQLRETIERVESEDPKLLRRQISELQKKVRESERTQIQEKIRVEQVAVISREQVYELKRAAEHMVDLGNGILKQLAKHAEISITEPDQLDMAYTVNDKTGNQVAPPEKIEPQFVTKRDPATPFMKEVKRTGKIPGPLLDGDVSLRAGERRILEVLAQRYPMKVTRPQLGTLSKFKASGGTFGNYFSTLKRNGLLDESGGEILITQQGLDYLGESVPEPQTQEQLLDMWRSSLRAGEAKMLDELIGIYPASLSRVELGDRTGFTASGGTFGNYLSALRRNGLVEVDGGEVRASDTLFMAVK
jgi:hypothetical protein